MVEKEGISPCRESGKGFAVVASEIGNLASSSRDTAERIQTITAGVVQSVEKLWTTSSEVLEFIETHVKEAYNELMITSQQYSMDTTCIGEVFETIH